MRCGKRISRHSGNAFRDFGWSEGRNIRFDYHFTEDSMERMRTAAAEVVGTAPNVIFVSTNSVVSAVLRLTHTIPIVFTWVSISRQRLRCELSSSGAEERHRFS